MSNHSSRIIPYSERQTRHPLIERSPFMAWASGKPALLNEGSQDLSSGQAEGDETTTMEPVTGTDWNMGASHQSTDEIDLERLFTTLQDDGLCPPRNSSAVEPNGDEPYFLDNDRISFASSECINHSPLSGEGAESVGMERILFTNIIPLLLLLPTIWTNDHVSN